MKRWLIALGIGIAICAAGMLVFPLSILTHPVFYAVTVLFQTTPSFMASRPNLLWSIATLANLVAWVLLVYLLLWLIRRYE